MHTRPAALLLLALTFSASAAPARTFPVATLRAIDAAIGQAIAEGKIPGGVFHLERGGAVYQRAYGRRAVVPAPEVMTEETIFDAASITKVMATTPSVWLLIERGKVALDDPITKYLPEFHGGWRDEVTIRHLLTHTSGLRPDLDLDTPWSGYDTAMKRTMEEMPRNRPGYVFRYSDINFLLLGELVRRVGGAPLDEFARREIFAPLRMRDTRFKPTDLSRVAPTEQLPDGTMLRGVVHDPTSRRMGGVAGHAGLFTTAADLSRYARMLLRGGELDGVRVLQATTVRAMTGLTSPPNVAVRRAGGFDLDSGYSRPRGDLFPLGSYGHTGYTGGFFWIDPFSRTFYLFLSNRVHPDGKGNVVALQRRLGTLAADAAGVDAASAIGALAPRRGGPVGWVTGGADVNNGIDVLHAHAYRELQGLRVGLITNHTGIDRAGNPTIDDLRSAPGVQLVALFSPEHGIRGEADEKTGDTVDAISGLPVYSLYGERRAPSAEQLANLDALVFDIQDVGARFYTYISTLGMAMRAAAAAGKKVIVLDRVNPIGGESVEGPLPEGESTFISYHPIPLRHGMTVGELARLFQADQPWERPLDLTVIAVRGWKREQWQDEAGLPWINTSPNMRSLAAAALYPGIGLQESAISVGRGTATPFELLGAPYIDGVALSRELAAMQLPGIRFEPVRFTPTASIFKNEPCGGVTMTISDRRTLQPVRTGIALAIALHRLYPAQYALDKLTPLLRQPAILAAIRDGHSLDEIAAMWQADEAAFRERRAKVLLY
ncbi:MAG: pbpE 6 [Acidobacteria bacterium]|nr:pbpE 6 [Acidobacteriota bacterium]